MSMALNNFEVITLAVLFGTLYATIVGFIANKYTHWCISSEREMMLRD